MSQDEYNFISSKTLADLINLPSGLVIDWLDGQHQAVGEAVAKACYQALSDLY